MYIYIYITMTLIQTLCPIYIYIYIYITRTLIQALCPNCIALRASKKGVRSFEVSALAVAFEKSATELRHRQSLLKCKSTLHISTFNVRTLDRIGQLAELTASVIEHNIDIVCVQEHTYHHSQVVIRYHDNDNGWTFVSVLRGVYADALGRLCVAFPLQFLGCIR